MRFRARNMAALLLASLLPGAVIDARQGADPDLRDLHRHLRDYEIIRMDPERAEEDVRLRGRLSLALRDWTLDMVLEPIDLRAPGYVAEETGDAGPARIPERPVASTYKGILVGMKDSQVRFTFDGSRIEGLVLTPADWFYVEPLRNFVRSAVLSDLIVYRRSAIREETFGMCGTTLAHRIGQAPERLQLRAMAAEAGVRVAQIATEADYEYVTALGGSTAANNEILQILNQISGIYETELGISFQVVYQHAWATTGDPYSATSAGSILNEFTSYWVNHPPGVGYDLAHMWTGKDMDGSTVGIAWLGVVCNAPRNSYGVSQRLTSIPAKYIVTAHEIGHNFGASHPDQANPPQTTCANTIMNSSIGTGISFCEFSRDEIGEHVSAYSSCLAAGSMPCDVNSDGLRNIADVQALVNVILGTASPSGACDINHDGRVDVLDLQALCNVILGLCGCP
ncbi:MAG: hypothetical protein HXY20_05685 [Acidobacteria bacterium]|nr:hypothetical protein [Acidobacteriota bacterium]